MKFGHNGHAQNDLPAHTRKREMATRAITEAKTYTDGHLELASVDEIMYHGFPIKLKQKGTVFEDFKRRI